MNIKHESRSDSWGTPAAIIERVRRVLGGIDYDPASAPWAQETVKAAMFHDALYDSLENPWPVGEFPRSVFLNPPGGKLGNKSKTVLFWKKLMEYRYSGQLSHAVFLAFSLEALQTTQSCAASVGIFPLCVPEKRLRFLTPDGKVGSAPSNGNCIVYVPGTTNNTGKFISEFYDLGVVINT